MLHLGQPAVWMLPVRSSTTYTKGQQDHLGVWDTGKMGTSCHSGWSKVLPWKLMTHPGLENFFILCYAIIEGALWPLLSLVQECIIKSSNSFLSKSIKSYHAPIPLRPPTHFPLLVANWDSAAVVPESWWTQKPRFLTLALDLCCRTFLGIVTVSQAWQVVGKTTTCGRGT